jgi:hypothetical protein
VYTLALPSRKNPTSVIPNASAVSTAKLDGAPTAAMKAIRAITAF